MEQLNQHPLEVAVETVQNIGNFVVERLLGGGWTELSQLSQEDVQPTLFESNK